MPQEIIYACPSCAYEGRKGDKCSECKVLLVACCAHCGNRVVGEHVQVTGDQEK